MIVFCSQIDFELEVKLHQRPSNPPNGHAKRMLLPTLRIGHMSAKASLKHAKHKAVLEPRAEKRASTAKRGELQVPATFGPIQASSKPVPIAARNVRAAVVDDPTASCAASTAAGPG